MYKLMILMPGSDVLPDLFDQWPDFLHQAELLPGLKREATSHVQHTLLGNPNYTMIHELFFDSLESLQAAMASVQGRKTAAVLHQMTRGKVTLLIADHQEDAIENLNKYKPAAPADDKP